MIYFFNLDQKSDDELISHSKEENTGLFGERNIARDDGGKNCSPSEKVIKNILNFSKSYATAKTTSSGYVEMNLN